MPTKPGQILEIIDMALDSGQLLMTLPKIYHKFVKGDDPEDLKRKQFEEFCRTGEIKNMNDQAISAWTTGLTDADEARLLGEVCHLVREGKINADQGWTVFVFLKRKGRKIRTRFREVYVAQPDQQKRYSIIFTLAALESDEKRLDFLIGDGITDPTFMDDLQRALEQPFEDARRIIKARIATLEERERQRDLANPPKAKQRKGGGWGAAMGDLVRIKLF